MPLFSVCTVPRYEKVLTTGRLVAFIQTGIQPEGTHKAATANVSTGKLPLLHKQQEYNGPSGYANVCLTLLYLYRARNKITQLSIPTHAQLQRHRLKFI